MRDNENLFVVVLVLVGVVLGLCVAWMMMDYGNARDCDGVYAKREWSWSTETRCIPEEVWNP